MPRNTHSPYAPTRAPSYSSRGSATASRSRRSPRASAATSTRKASSSWRIGGAQGIGRYLNLYGPRGLGLTLAGLCDSGEEGEFRRGLERGGLGTELTRQRMEALGFYVCEADLEDELIRALGRDRVQNVVAANGDLKPFRTLQKQPEWRDRPANEQLRRFMGSGGRRKIRYARFLVEALDLAQVPRPLALVLSSLERMS